MIKHTKTVVGKTIESGYRTGGYLLLTFTDGTFCEIASYMEWENETGAPVITNKSETTPWEQHDAGIITKEEARERTKKNETEFREKKEASERAHLKELKEKYENT